MNTKQVFRKGRSVRLINDARVRHLEALYPGAPQSRSTIRIKVGTQGEIIATRLFIDSAVLVKFQGCRFQISLLREHLELLPESD